MRYAFENKRRRAVREAVERSTKPDPSMVLDHIKAEDAYTIVFYMKDGTTYTVKAAGFDGEVECVTEHPNAA